MLEKKGDDKEKGLSNEAEALDMIGSGGRI